MKQERATDALPRVGTPVREVLPRRLADSMEFASATGWGSLASRSRESCRLKASGPQLGFVRARRRYWSGNSVQP